MSLRVGNTDDDVAARCWRWPIVLGAILVVILLGVFEYGRIVMVKQVMDNAACRGRGWRWSARTRTLTTTTAMIQAQVTTCLAGHRSRIQPSWSTRRTSTTAPTLSQQLETRLPFGSDIAVEIDATYAADRPQLPSASFPTRSTLVSKSEVMRSEAN